MAPKVARSQGKEKSFTWSETMTKTLLITCREYQKKHGHEVAFSWVDIAEGFEKRTGIKCHYSVAKNKFDHMKQIWRAWTDLRYNETGIGWNESTWMVVADDAWWEKKLKENDKYKRFCKKGVAPDISELWDQVFGCIVAIGKHCMAPSMDPNAATVVSQQIADEYEDEGEYLGQEEAFDDNDTGFEDGLMGLNMDGNADEVLESAYNILTGTPSNVTVPSHPRAKKGIALHSSPKLNKRTKKKSLGSAIYNQHLEIVGQTSERLISLLEGEIGSSAPAPSKKTYDFGDAMVVIKEMVVEGLLVEASVMWCFAVSELRKEESREAFMNIEKNSARVAWLNYEFQTQTAARNASR